MGGTADFLRSQGLLSESSTYKDLVSTVEKKKHRGFCVNKKCIEPKKNYKVIGSRALGSFISENKDQDDCPFCDFPLFWSNRFKRRVNID